MQSFINEQLLFQDTGLPLAIYIFDKKNKLIEANQFEAKILKMHKPQDVIGFSTQDLLDLSDADKLNINNQKVLYHNKPQFYFETANMLPGAGEKQKLIGFSWKKPFLLKSGKVHGIIGASLIVENNCLFPSSFNDPIKLTNRQIDVLLQLAKGHSVKGIAKQLNLSPKTVENHITVLRLKLNCLSKSELIEHALSIPLIVTKLLFTT